MWGPSPSELDKFCEAALPELHVGEWLYFKDVGAYGVTSASNFCGFCQPTSYYYITEDCRWGLCVCACMRVHICVCMHVCVCMCVCVCIYMCVHTLCTAPYCLLLHVDYIYIFVWTRAAQKYYTCIHVGLCLKYQYVYWCFMVLSLLQQSLPAAVSREGLCRRELSLPLLPPPPLHLWGSLFLQMRPWKQMYKSWWRQADARCDPQLLIIEISYSVLLHLYMQYWVCMYEFCLQTVPCSDHTITIKNRKHLVWKTQWSI